VDDAFLVGMLDRLTDRYKEFQPLPDWQVQLKKTSG
jgi:hypothetical protein